MQSQEGRISSFRRPISTSSSKCCQATKRSGRSHFLTRCACSMPRPTRSAAPSRLPSGLNPWGFAAYRSSRSTARKMRCSFPIRTIPDGNWSICLARLTTDLCGAFLDSGLRSTPSSSSIGTCASSRLGVARSRPRGATFSSTLRVARRFPAMAHGATSTRRSTTTVRQPTSHAPIAS